MQHDDVIWGSLHRHFCSYKVTTNKAKFCRNKYNLTGVCGRVSCPLANSRYATIVENDNRLYLFIKTAERAHSPRRLWQRIRLSAQYRRALTQIDEHLQFWPQFYVHKAKQRLTKMTQYLIRKRKLSVQAKSRLVGIKKKVDRREQSREVKAQRAAKLEASIEKQLLERLKSNAYGDIYNFDQDAYEKVLDEHMNIHQDGGEMQLDGEDEDENEFEAQYEDEDESDDEEVVEEEDDESDEEDEYADDIEGSANRISSDGQFDFDDEEGDSDSGSDNTQDDQDEKALPRPRTANELDAYVREKAKQRAKAKKTAPTRAGRKKGRKLRPQRDGVRVEVEYERESERQAIKATR